MLSTGRELSAVDRVNQALVSGIGGVTVIATLKLFASGQLAISAGNAWYLSDLDEFCGKQEPHTRHSPQRLKALREHALIEGAVSSNRIEGVSLEVSRLRDLLVSLRPLFRDRDEEDVRGYRDALDWIHKNALVIPISEESLLRLHAMALAEIREAGTYKERDCGIR